MSASKVLVNGKACLPHRVTQCKNVGHGEGTTRSTKGTRIITSCALCASCGSFLHAFGQTRRPQPGNVDRLVEQTMSQRVFVDLFEMSASKVLVNGKASLPHRVHTRQAWLDMGEGNHKKHIRHKNYNSSVPYVLLVVSFCTLRQTRDPTRQRRSACCANDELVCLTVSHKDKNVGHGKEPQEHKGTQK
jgi:hypothetical protein